MSDQDNIIINDAVTNTIKVVNVGYPGSPGAQGETGLQGVSKFIEQDIITEVFEGLTTKTVSEIGGRGTVIDFIIRNRPGLWETLVDIQVFIQGQSSFFNGALVQFDTFFTPVYGTTGDWRIYAFIENDWPAGRFFRVIMRSRKPGKWVVGIGDSIMVGGGASTYPTAGGSSMYWEDGGKCCVGNSTVQQVAYYEKSWFKQMMVPGAVFVQRGYGGSTAQQWCESVSGVGNYLTLKRHYVDQSTVKPDYCIIQMGGNDITNVSLDSAKTYYAQAVERIVSDGITPILCNYPPFDNNSPILPNAADIADPFNDWVIEYAIENNHKFIDFRSIEMTKPSSYPSTLDYSGTGVSGSDYSDGVHFNNSGYEKMAKYAAIKISEILGNTEDVGATVEVGTVTTSEPGGNASVVNVGTALNAVLDISLPRGEQGIQGTDGVSVSTAIVNEAGNLIITRTDGEIINAGNVIGPIGQTGATGDAGEAATIEIGTVTTGDPGTNASVINVGTTNAAIFDITIPRGETGASGSGSGDMLAATYDPVLMSITGKSSGTTNADVSLKTLWEQVDTKEWFIPAGFTFAPTWIADRNRTIKFIKTVCKDSSKNAQNPTSLVLTIKGGSDGTNTIYTSSAITTARSTSGTTSIDIASGEEIEITTSNSNGITSGGITVILGLVNR